MKNEHHPDKPYMLATGEKAFNQHTNQGE